MSIFEGNGCWSFVGKQPSLREQSLSLERSCTDHTFVVAHEIAHTLGFYHEHARGDRDQFISIDYSNVNPNLTFAFAKVSFFANFGLEIQNLRNFFHTPHFFWMLLPNFELSGYCSFKST